MITPKTTKFKVNYIGKGMYRCVYLYEMKHGFVAKLVVFGKSHREAIYNALNQYKELTLKLL